MSGGDHNPGSETRIDYSDEGVLRIMEDLAQVASDPTLLGLVRHVGVQCNPETCEWCARGEVSS